MKARTAIGNSLPYHSYCLFKHYESIREVMEKLIVVYDEEMYYDAMDPKQKCLMAHIDEFHTNDS